MSQKYISLLSKIRGVPAIFLLLLGSSNSMADFVTFTDIAKNPESGVVYERTPTDGQVDRFLELIGREDITNYEIFRMPNMQRGNPGVAVFDYDNDGDLDLYVTNGPGTANSLFSNQLVEEGHLAFVDVAEEANVDATEHRSTGVTYGDIDNDGDADLLILGKGEPNRLFENNGDGSFIDITEFSGVGGGNLESVSGAFGDINGDGLLDIVVANITITTDYLAIVLEPWEFNQPNLVYLNKGNNIFEDVSESSGIRVNTGVDLGREEDPTISWGVALADYDEDGDVDIFFTDDSGAIPSAKEGGVNRGLIQVFQNDGTGQFTNITTEIGTDVAGSWMGITFGDYDHNGKMDFFATNFGDWGTSTFPGLDISINTKSKFFFYQRLDGTFYMPDQIKMPFGWGASSADFDNDGHTDVTTYGGLKATHFYELTNPGIVLSNDGKGVFSWEENTFEEDNLRRLVHGVAVGDLNNDGFVDIINASSDNMPTEYTVRHPASFPEEPLDVAARILPVFESTGADTFRLTENYLQVGNGSLEIMINNGGNDNNWAEFTVQGNKDIIPNGKVNRDGVGAVVKFLPKIKGATGTTGSLIQPVLGGGSHASQDSQVVIFGMGESKKGTVEVLWPGGVWNKLYNVKAGERILLPEIPCSYKQNSNKRRYYKCVRKSIHGLVHADIIKKGYGKRLLASAIRAFHAERKEAGGGRESVKSLR